MTNKEMLRISTEELARNAALVVERISRTKERILVEHNGNALAMLAPVTSRGRSRSVGRRTATDFAAARSAAGSWAEEDADGLIARVRESRAIPPRPRADL